MSGEIGENGATRVATVLEAQLGSRFDREGDILYVRDGSTPGLYLYQNSGVWEQVSVEDSNSYVVRADMYPGSDAGVQIAAAIAALPSDGGLVDATGFSSNQNLTGFTIPPGVKVQLGPVTFTTVGALPITVNQGASLYGMGCNSPGQTRIKLGNGLNRNIIECVSSDGAESGFWHHGELRNFRADGNKANNTLGTGVKVVRMAETSLIQRLTCQDCAEDGVLFTGSNAGTSSIENVTVNANGISGVHVDDYRSGLLMKSVGGDNNPITLWITNPNTSGGPMCCIDFKSEKNNAGPCIQITGGTSMVDLTLIGGNAATSGDGGLSLIVIDADVAGASPVITIIGMFAASYTTLIEDNKTSNTLTSPNSLDRYCGILSYCGGRYVRFDSGGWVSSFPPSKFTSINVTTGTLAQYAITGANYVSLMSTNATPGNQTTRTATQMFSDHSFSRVGTTYTLVITQTGANAFTLVAGEGVTLTGTMTIAQNTTRTFIVTFDSATTATIQSIGTGTYS